MPADRKYSPEAGAVGVTLAGVEYTLRPTLDAALTLSRQAGGIRAAITRVLDLDLDTIISVIRLGIGREEAKRLKNLDRIIWENGLLDAQGELVLRCVEYLSNLARGGRPEGSSSAGDGDDSPDPTTQQ